MILTPVDPHAVPAGLSSALAGPSSALAAAIAIALCVPVALPALVFAASASAAVIGRPLRGIVSMRLARAAFLGAALAVFAAAVGFLYGRSHGFPAGFVVPLGHWFAVEDAARHHYGFDLEVRVDGLAILFAATGALLLGTVGAFSVRYLRREDGADRFFRLLMLFAAAFSLLVIAGSLDLLFVGWELVGITSAMLIGFYRDRTPATRHAVLALTVYRVCDAALLLVLIGMHHAVGTGSFGPLDQPLALSAAAATWFGVGLWFAGLGKGAQWPLTAWLPRAMEGPTSSSAVFYGALSVHAGVYVLLRTEPLWGDSVLARLVMLTSGALTVVMATLSGRVQSDVKSSQAFASAAQVGIITVEVALGWTTLAMWHACAHAIARTYALLRAPNVIAEHQQVERALGRPMPSTGDAYERWLPAHVRAQLYGYALARGRAEFVAASALQWLRRGVLWLDALDQWCSVGRGVPQGGTALSEGRSGRLAAERWPRVGVADDGASTAQPLASAPEVRS